MSARFRATEGAAAFDLDRVVGLLRQLPSDRPEIASAKALVASAWSDRPAATSNDRLWERPETWIGAGALASIAGVGGGLAAKRRRGGKGGEGPDRETDAGLTRREMLSLIGVAGAVGAGSMLRPDLPSAGAATQTARSGLNVLAIVIDDLNDYPTYLGGAPMPVHTPNIDALAAQSRNFVNHHVTVPLCPPSRATLMFGDDVASHGMPDSRLDGSDFKAFADSAIERSLPVVARNAGVTTIGGGKLFHFNKYAERWDDYLYTNPVTGLNEAGGGSFDFGPMLDDRNPDQDLTDFIRGHLRDHDGSTPFLMMAGLRLPHLPWRVPQRLLDLYPLDSIVLPETPENDWDDLGPVAIAQLEQYVELYGAGWFEIVEREHDRAALMQAYLASMTHTDEMVGQLIEELDASPFADTTAVVLVSDNGYHQGENFAYRKLTLRDQATKTPFLIRPVDGMDLTAERVDQVVSSTCFMPTILDILGVTPTEPLSGVSLLGDRLPPALVMTHVHNSVSLVFGGENGTGGRWTMHFEPGTQFDPALVSLDDVAEMEFYDRATDPDEFDNLLRA